MGRERLCLLTGEEWSAKSAGILEQLRNLPELAAARVIMGFAALPEEVDLAPLWRRLLAESETLAFPLILGMDGRMDAVAVTDLERDLKPGCFRVLQPLDGIALDPREIDLVFVPALTYDMNGHRLGRGGGFYDRFLAGRAPEAFRCGVGFECQVIEAVPAMAHDRKIDALVTEKGVRRLDKRKNRLSDVVYYTA